MFFSMFEATLGGPVGPRYRIVQILGRGGEGTALLVEDLARDGARLVLKWVGSAGGGVVGADGADRAVGADGADRAGGATAGAGGAIAGAGGVSDGAGGATAGAGGAAAELELLDGAEHPNIGAPTGLLHAAGQVFIESPWWPGGDLISAVWPGPPPSRRLGWALEVLRGLAFLHERGITHRDLKPENVVLDASGAARVIDFGLAVRSDGGRGEISGTPAYLAPELLRGERAGPAADLFSFGGLLYWLVAERLPFGGDSATQLRERLAGRPPDPMGPGAGAPPGIESLVTALLSPAPLERPTAAQALEALRRALPSTPPSETAATLAARVVVSGLFARGEASAVLERARAALKDGTGTAPPIVWVVGAPGTGRTAALVASRRAALAEGLRAPEALSPRSAEDLGRWLGLATTGDLSAELLAASRDQPCLLHVDDVHRATPAVTDLLRLVVRAQPGTPRLGLVLSVPLHAWNDPSVERLRGDLEAFSETERVELGPLTEGDVRSLVGRLGPGEEVPATLASDLFRLTGGQPTLVQAALRALIREGDVPLCTGRPFPTGLTGAARLVPETLLEAARADVAALDAAATDAAEAVAILGGRFDVEALAGLLDVDVRGALARAASRGILALVPGPSGVEASLCGAAVEQALLARRPERELRVLRRTLASRVEDAGGRSADVLATLYAGAEDWARAAQWALRAGRFRDASELLERQLAGEAAPEARRELFEQLALALASLAEFDSARAALARLQAEQPGAVAESSWLRLAEVELDAGRPRDTIDILAHCPSTPASRAFRARAHLLLGERDAAIDALDGDGLGPPPEPPADLDVHARLTRALVIFYSGRYDEALEAAKGLAASVERAGTSPREHPMLLNAVGIVQQRRGELDDAARWYARSLDAARQQGNLARAGIALMNLGTLRQEAGALGEALRRYGEAAAIARRTGDETALVKALMNEANLLVQAASLTDAERSLRLAMRLAARIGNRFLGAYLRLLLADARAKADRHDEASRLAREARDSFEALGSVREACECTLLLARSALLTRRFDALLPLADALALAGSSLPSTRFELWSRLLRAEHERGRLGGDLATAHAGLEEALRAAGEDERPEDLWRVHRALASSFAALGRSGDAELHARTASRLLSSLAERLEAPLRGSFLALPEHRAALEAAALLTRGATDGGGGEPGFLRQVLELNKRLGTETEPERLLRTILDVAIAMTGAERGFLLTPVGEGDLDDFAVRAARNFDGETLKRTNLKFSTSVAEEVLLTGQPILSLDAMDDERLRENRSVAAMKLRSVLCVPMRHRGVSLGVIYVDNRFQRGAFSAQQLAFMEAFADQAALALHSVEVVRREHSARLQAEAASRALEASRREVERLNGELRAELAVRSADLETTRRELETRYRYEAMVGSSPPMRRLFGLLDRVTSTSVPVLVTGESGTGKELVARALHMNGPRAASRFVSVNCAALPETLLESELFGYVRGAFTGADRDRAGLFEQAHQGTLLLDEVGEMSLAMQAKLLRALETHVIRRLGDVKDIAVDVRLLAATNRDLRERVRVGEFREDLLYRLQIVEIRLPALRERREDVPLLAAHFLEAIATRHGAPRKALTPGALHRLMTHAWPGNVRQLEAVLTSAVLLGDGATVTEGDLQLDADAPAPTGAPGQWDGVSTLDAISRAVVRDAWERLGRNKSKAAAALGIDRNTLYAKLRP